MIARFRSPCSVRATLALALAMLTPAAPALAQDNGGRENTVAEIRLRRLEAEVRALQRQVFPGPGGAAAADGAVVAAPPLQLGTPATTPVTDLLTRMDAVEAQMSRLTASNEENSNRLRQIETRLGTLQPAGQAGAQPATDPLVPRNQEPDAPMPPRPTPLVNDRGALSTLSAPAPAPRTLATARPAPTRPSPTRLAAVKAVVKPQTNDPGDDDYTYGYKLWQAKFYPEAEQQLKLFLDKYPRHPRVSYARNLLGRAFYDDGHPREAAPWFLQNYQSNKHGDRAPDSLLYLAQSMVALQDTNRACIALGEFADTYPTETAGRLKAQYAEARTKVTCN